MCFTVSVMDGLYEVVDMSLCIVLYQGHCLFMYFNVSVTDGLYEVVDMSLCGNCGSGATCYCDSLSDRLPLCACQQHFYPSGDQCIGEYLHNRLEVTAVLLWHL